MTEAVIRTNFGEIRLTFQTSEELYACLQEIERQMKLIQAAAERIAPPSPRTPKLGYQSYYRFAPSGSVELLKFPEKQNEAVALVLYACHPETVTSQEIEKATGIDDVARRVLTQRGNKDFFRKADDKYGLTFEGLQMVQERFAQGTDRGNNTQPTDPE